jgi:S1-C subfamily serine protease
MMRNILAVIAAIAVLAVPLRADQWVSVIEKAQKAVLYMEMSEGSCTAFVINVPLKYVMTAAHCYDKEGMWVDRVAVTVVSLDTKKDLMILKVDNLDPEKVALKLADKNPEIRTDVLSVGYGYGLERPFFKTAHVADTAVMIPEAGIGGPFIGVDASYTGGQSGGPVLNGDGEVVSIVQRGDGGTLGLGAGAEIIRERVGRFWSNK